MKTWILSLALLSGAVHASSPAPAFELPGSLGPVSLAALRGHLVYLDFWASWCGPCQRSFPWMNSLQERYAARGLVVVAVNVDSDRSAAEAFLARIPAGFRIAFDAAGATPKAYAIKGMPSSVLIGADGSVIASHTGFTAATPAAVEADIERALGGAKGSQ